MDSVLFHTNSSARETLTLSAVAAIALWDFSHHCEPHSSWEETAAAVDPKNERPRRDIWDEIMKVRMSRMACEEGL